MYAGDSGSALGEDATPLAGMRCRPLRGDRGDGGTGRPSPCDGTIGCVNGDTPAAGGVGLAAGTPCAGVSTEPPYAGVLSPKAGEADRASRRENGEGVRKPTGFGADGGGGTQEFGAEYVGILGRDRSSLDDGYVNEAPPTGMPCAGV